MNTFFIRHSLFFYLIFITIATPLMAQQLKYPPAKPKWDRDSLGNHRAVLQVDGQETIAKGKIVWRRRDRNVKDKALILIDAKTGKRVLNLITPKINRFSCTLYFQHLPGHSTYYLYYMPYQQHGYIHYPTDFYPQRKETADKDWIASVKKKDDFAKVKLIKLEPATPFDRFTPMELIASKKETNDLIAAHPDVDYLVFPEDRQHPIKMKKDIPYRWINEGVQSSFSGSAKRGEYYAFQLGIYPIKKGLHHVQIDFSEFKDNHNHRFSDTLISCINTEGISYRGDSVSFTVDIPQKEVQAMWCYIKVPADIPPGTYHGKATLSAKDVASTSIPIHLTITSQRAINHGVDQPWKMTRLPWLNSTLYQKNTVIDPYIPLKKEGNNIRLLGRKLQIAPSGLPKQIKTFFPIEMTSISEQANPLLTHPINFHFVDPKGRTIQFRNKGVTFTKKTPGTIEWKAENKARKLKTEIKGHLEFDGFLSYQVKVIARKDISLKDISLHIPIQPKEAKYFMGLGYKGGKRHPHIDWTWDVKHKNQDGGWIGNVNAGLKFSLRDQHYSRPLNTNFYLQKPLILPTSWGNDNKGGIHIGSKGNSVLVNAYSGTREMKKGDTLYYNFRLLITPFHPLQTKQHWTRRYFHDYKPIDSVKAVGANVINVHQGKYPNPYINYPYIAWKQLKAYIDSAHQAGMKVKIYNTIRELADRAYELYPMRSLNHEIFSPGKGGGYPWLQEHLDGDYIAAWYTPETNDAAIVNGGQSRWHNYYIEGLKWLVHKVGIDGLYLDDVAFDRVTMKRVKRALTQNGHPGIIDLHSANQHNKSDGWNNSANLYMSLFPYLNRLWFGEYFDYNKNGPDFFMTEVSGIPFGLMGEMLQDGGNPWRGMLYGMTNRYPWTGGDPRPVWKVWTDFGIQNSEMVGYWVPDNPVKTDNEKILATVYEKRGKTLVALASWAKKDTTVHIKIDWPALGINPLNATITAPYIKNFQSQATFKQGEAIPVKKGKGRLLIIGSHK